MMKMGNLLMLSIVLLLWGSSFALLKLGLEEIPPINLAFLRFIIAVPFFVLYAYFKDKSILDKWIFRDWKILMMLGLTGVTLYHTFQNVGLQFTTASNSSLIISANPIFIVLLDHFYMNTRITRKRIFGIVLSLIGIIVVMGPLRLIFSPASMIGDMLSLGAALSWAFYSVFGKNVVSKYGAQKTTMVSMIFGTLFLFPIMLFSERPVLPTSMWLWFLLLILSLLCSGMAYLVWYKVIEEVSATEAGVFLFFLPVISILFAKIILMESIDAFFIVGASLVMLGVIVTERG